MATISASQDLDNAARSAGEAFTINTAATLTINTDTRWHKNAPSGADWGKGSIGSLTATAATGGTILIDATDVKWVPYTNGAGNVPALGSTITGLTSAETGELLGVYDTIAVAPTAAGAAMPANGFLKFKSTTGDFDASETLDTFAGCDTNGATVTGWIEVARDELSIATISRTGLFQTRGDWFYLDDTTGARSQSLQAPNPGGASTYYPAVWIEDGFLDGAMADDGGTFTDETGAANQDTADDMTLLPAAPVQEDAYYFGYYDTTFTTLQLKLTTQGAGVWTITWEYWDGDSWEALAGVADGTTGFTAAVGWQTVTWNLPGDWARTTVNNVNAYWVRARLSAFTNLVTQPKGGQAGINGSDVYTKWPAMQGTTYFGASHQGKDERSKFVSCQGGGLLVIGNNSVADVGALPVPGCHTRIPNILLNSCATADRTANTVPHATLATRPDFLTTSAGQIDIEYTLGDWYFSFSQPYSVSMKYSATFDRSDITECATAVVLEDFCNGNYKNGDEAALVMSDDRAGITLTNCKLGRTGTIGSSDYGINIQYSNDITVTDCHFGNRAFRTHAAAYVCYFGYCDTVTVDNLELVGSALYTVATFTITINDVWYADSYHQTSSATTPPVGSIYIGAGSKTASITGGGWYTRIANLHPDTSYLYCLGATDVRWSEMGTRSLPISGGTVNAMLYAYRDGGRNINVEIKRVYFSNIGTRFINGINSSSRILVENCAGDYADAMGTSATAGLVSLNATVKNHAAASQYTAFTSVYGTIFYNIYTSTSAGRLGVAFNEDTTYQTGYVTKSFTGATGFTSAGTLALQNLNDNIIYEYPYWIYGIDSFQNLDVVISGTNTANHTVQYQIDTGTGYGALTAATAANLSGEVFTAAGGFRLKIKITCNNAATTNALTGCYILTNADTNAQDVQYPLDTYTLTLTGLENNTRVAIIEAGTETLVEVLDESGGEVEFEYPDTDAGDSVDIAILAAGFLYQRISAYTLTAANVEIPISQATDYGYDGGTSATVTFNGGTHRIVCDAATTEIDVIGVYTEWVDWALTDENLKYDAAFSEVGGNTIDAGAGTSIPVYGFLTNTWRIAPDEADHTLNVTGGIVLVDGGGDPFVDTAGAFTVRINYQQPVQAITVATGAVTPEDVADAVWDELVAAHLTAGSFGLSASKVKSWVGWLRSLL